MGSVFGVAGGSLGDSSWAASKGAATAGMRGERLAGELLNQHARRVDGPTVLHDVSVPGSPANIDHIVVSGRNVMLIDSKLWRPGVYWGWGGRAWHGVTRNDHARRLSDGGDGKPGSVLFARERLTPVVEGAGGTITSVNVWVFPSQAGRRVHTFLLRVVGGRVRSGWRMGASLRAWKGEGDPTVVGALLPLVRAWDGGNK